MKRHHDSRGSFFLMATTIRLLVDNPEMLRNNYNVTTHGIQNHAIKWSASFQRSFGPNSERSSREDATHFIGL